jgi:hypothetical protein
MVIFTVVCSGISSFFPLARAYVRCYAVTAYDRITATTSKMMPVDVLLYKSKIESGLVL